LVSVTGYPRRGALPAAACTFESGHLTLAARREYVGQYRRAFVPRWPRLVLNTGRCPGSCTPPSRRILWTQHRPPFLKAQCRKESRAPAPGGRLPAKMAGPPVKQASETIIRRSSTGSQVGGRCRPRPRYTPVGALAHRARWPAYRASRAGRLRVPSRRPDLICARTRCAAVWGVLDGGAGERNGFDGKGHQRHSTLSHVVLEEELAAKRKDPNQKGNFTLLMISIAGACKAIAHGVSRCLLSQRGRAGV
jgi:hypothetical protein